MKDRIKEYMDYKSISAGDLAASLDVQRSNISHVLNGRNKPGASFIERLLVKYPDLNARWLFTGEGNMTMENEKQVNIAAEIDNPTEVNLFSAIESKDEAKSAFEPNSKIKHKSQSENSVKKDVSPLQDKDSSTVEKMVLIFADGTFSMLTNRDNNK